MTTERVPSGRPRRPGGRRDAEGRDDGARALPGPREAPWPRTGRADRRRCRPACCPGRPRSSCPGSRWSGGARPARSRPTGATWPPTNATCAAARRPRHRRRPRARTWRRTWPACGRTHSAASVARAQSSLRGFHRFLVEEGLRGRRPDARPALDVGHRPVAQGAQRGGDGPPARARWSGPGPWSCATGRCSSSSTAPAPGSARWSGSTWATSADAVEIDGPAARPRARQGRQGARRPARAGMARAALADWLSGQGRALVVPEAVAPPQRRRGRVPQRPWGAPHPRRGLRRGQEVRRRGSGWRPR